MKRIRQPEGQLGLCLLEDTVEDVQVPSVTNSSVPVVQPAVRHIQTKFQAAPRIADVIEHPSVSLHKSGHRLYVKPNDPTAVDVLRDLKERSLVDFMRKPEFYGLTADTTTLAISLKDTHLWQCLQGEPSQHPYAKLIESYGVKVYVAPTLRNYLRKEARRQQIEAAPFKAPPIVTTVSLFDRCCEGTILRCIKEYKGGPAGEVLFAKDKRYMVLQAGGEGTESVVLSTREMGSKATLSTVGNGARFEWSEFMSAMEKHFDDSESMESKPDIEAQFPVQVKMMKERLKKRNLALYEHVAEDAAVMALKRGVINAYPMRMAKTSSAIAVAELTGSQKVGVLSPGNARIFWEKEFERLGFKENVDYTVIRSLDDTRSQTKYHLLTYTWLRQGDDPAWKARNDWSNWLKPSTRPIKQDVDGEKKIVDVELVNNCPHCKKAMERRVFDAEKMAYEWTTKRGFICRNTKCTWVTDNRGKTGAAWCSPKNKLVQHKGHYIDIGLAAHARCPDERLKGRFCPHCKQADSTWVPPRGKRLRKRYTMLIDDEIHGCKDDLTATSRTAFSMRGRRRMGLTGTLLSNSPMDAYWPLHWTQNAQTQNFPYHRQPGEKEFDTRFCDQVFLERAAGSETDSTGKVVQSIKLVKKRVPFLRNPPDFWSFMEAKVVRRTYQDPLFIKTLTANGRMMPTVDIHKAVCPMVPAQAQLMLAAMKDFKGTFDKLAEQAKSKNQEVNPTLVISQMTSMGIIATCPEMINQKLGIEAYKGIDGGGKLSQIKKLIDEKVLQGGGKVLILSDFLAMQKTVEAAVKTQCEVIRFQTSWDDETRKEAFDAFQQDDAKKVFIAGTRAIREGVDLSSADTVICCDLLWSPAFQTQAWSRIMAPATRERICNVYLMLSKNSIDDHKYNVFYSKIVAAQQAMDRRVTEKRALSVDITSFVSRILDEQMSIESYLRDQGEAVMYMPQLKLSDLELRAV